MNERSSEHDPVDAAEPHGDAAEAGFGEPGQSGQPAAAEPDDALISRLALIEQQPLAERATAYLQLHDELSAILEGSDAQGGRPR